MASNGGNKICKNLTKYTRTWFCILKIKSITIEKLCAIK